MTKRDALVHITCALIPQLVHKDAMAICPVKDADEAAKAAADIARAVGQELEPLLQEMGFVNPRVGSGFH
jgi:hypothetical protein